MAQLDMQETMDIANAKAIDALIIAAHDTGLAHAYGGSLDRVRAIAAETSRLVAELEAQDARDAA